MKQRVMRGLEKPKDTGFIKLINSVFKCAKNTTTAFLDWRAAKKGRWFSMTEGKLNSVFIFLEFFPILSDYKSTMEMLSFYADLGLWVCVSVNHEGIFLFVIRLYSSNCDVHIFVQYSSLCVIPFLQMIHTWSFVFWIFIDE